MEFRFKSYGGFPEAIISMKQPILDSLDLAAPYGEQWAPRQCQARLSFIKQCPSLAPFVNTINGLILDDNGNFKRRKSAASSKSFSLNSWLAIKIDASSIFNNFSSV